MRRCRNRETVYRRQPGGLEQAAPHFHAAHNNARLLDAFAHPGRVTFTRDILEALRRVGVEGKAVIQLACNNGRETVSLRNMGAARCVGVDAAEEFLAHGRQFAEAAGVADDVEFVCADIYDLPAALDGCFDIVLTTIGVVGWMPDIDAFFGVIRRLLKPGGRLVMEEMHPVLLMYEPNPATGVSTVAYSYFARQIWEETGGLDYYGGTAYAAKPCFSFMHRLDEILMAGLGNGLRLESFKELDYDISMFCSDLERSPTKPPLGFVMVMENAGG
ncbi:MAG: class I SAM-dependent methyltransferase [Alphaproteobacteria bacterium]